MALSFVVFPLGVIAASNTLSFTAHSLNLNPGDSALLLALNEQGVGYEVATVKDSSGRAWIRVTKTGAQGAVVATFQFGGTGTDTPAAIKVDAQGEVVIAGSTTSTDFPVTTSLVPAIQFAAAFVVKLDSGLTGIIASTLLGGIQYPSGPYCGTEAEAMDADSAGNVYLAGCTAAQDFPVTAGAYQTTPPMYNNTGTALLGFVAEISPEPNKIVFATYYGSSEVGCYGVGCFARWGSTNFTALAVDASGAIITSADVLLWASPPPSMSGSTIIKFAPGGGSVLWSTSINPNEADPDLPNGLSSSQTINALALDSSGNVIAAGTAADGANGTPGTVQPCFTSSSLSTGNFHAGFVVKLSSSSGALQFLTGFGCGGTTVNPSVNSVAVDASGTIWITGVADPSSLPITPTSSSGSSYLAALAADASSAQALYEEPAGIFGQALALTPTGSPVVLGAEGFLTLSNAAGGPSLLGVANSAGSTGSGLIAPAELVSFYGTGLGPATPLDTQVVGGVVGSTLGGYQLLFGGVAAPLLYISANQINAVVPNEASGQDSVSVALVTPSGTFPLADLSIRPSEPEVFYYPVSVDGVTNNYAAAINQDGTLNSAMNPAHAGEIVAIWGTGAGAACAMYLAPADGTIIPGAGVQPALPVSMLAGNDSLEVDYAGDSPGEVFGLLQVNFRIPQPLPSAAAASGSLAVSLQVGAAIGAPVSVYVAP